jgi:transcriptional regulator with XRE-family HTH domain
MSDTLGKKIKTIRKQLEMTQVDFAHHLGITQGRLSEIEQNKTKPSADTLIALRKRLKVDLNILLGDLDED